MVDNRGNRTETISEKSAKPGKNIYLSLDLDLQKMAEDSLKRTMNLLLPGSENKSKWELIRLIRYIVMLQVELQLF